MHIVTTDIVIVGGGVAGLWLLNRLRQQGFAVILLESEALGAGQTSKAQGIIHGGVKYALQGKLTPDAKAIAQMPQIWKDCLAGQGDIDLSQVPILSQQQYLWATNTFASKFTGMLAKLALKSATSRVKSSDYPDIFRHAAFKGEVYALDEIVIDVHALLYQLMQKHKDCIYKIDPMFSSEHLIFDEQHRLLCLKAYAQPLPPVIIKAEKYIFAAGEGNEIISKKLNLPSLAMQRRPLHMVLVKHTINAPVYAHCLGLGNTPRLTITTHRSEDGKFIWYLGGQLAESGVERNKTEQVAFAKQELLELFPWLDFSNAQFNSFLINRAENKEPGGKRPSQAYFKEINNIIIAWPTKLAFAPYLANSILKSLSQKISPLHKHNARALPTWPSPALASPIWEELFYNKKG